MPHIIRVPPLVTERRKDKSAPTSFQPEGQPFHLSRSLGGVSFSHTCRAETPRNESLH